MTVSRSAPCGRFTPAAGGAHPWCDSCGWRADLHGWPPAQRRVLATAGVTLVGLDDAGRPVVEQMAGIPQQLRRWAVTRAGDPTDVRGTVRSLPATRPNHG